MSTDISRQRFDPNHDFSAVLMQQGRVLLDADWNEAVEILDRRRRAETMDTIGRCVVPTTTPEGFEIGLDGSTLTIGPGRIYVDGLLAENHGAAPLNWDPHLAELHGESIAYEDQPYLPEAATVAPPPTSGGPHLVYVKVWRREVTPLQEPDLVESAVGVDSTTRWQTVWQVRVLEDVGEGVTCATPPESIDSWVDLVEPSAGRLSTSTTDVDVEDDPCVLPDSGGYRGLENRLYRVEIHEVDEAGNATFKWARHNASVATAVHAINGVNLVVELTGRDEELRFSTGDWVEVTDDVRELAGLPGIFAKVAGVTDATRTIELEDALPAGTFPTSGGGSTLPGRHTRIRRWDQKGEVRTTDDTLHFDLDSGSSEGLIPVPTDGTSLRLEHGIVVTFSLDPAGGRFRAGDSWVFAARSADASLELLEEAPPRSIHAHYCRLAVVTFGETPNDCRIFWPPEFGGHGCACTACVSPESHASGTLTIQQAIDQVSGTGGTVCLGAGLYNLSGDALRVSGANSVRLVGQGWRTILARSGPGTAIEVSGSVGFEMERLTLLSSRLQFAPADLTIRNSADVKVHGCYFLQVGGREVDKAAIGLSGALLHTSVRDNIFFAAGAVANASPGREDNEGSESAPLASLGLEISRNQMLCSDFGVRLRDLCLHLGDTTVADNFINDARDGGIRALGFVAANELHSSRFDIRGNALRVSGDGIACGVDAARIDENDIGQESASRSGNGIVIEPGIAGTPLHRLQVVQNRITGLEEHGIHLRADIDSGLIKLNQIEDVEGAAIFMDPQATAVHLAIENNQILRAANLTRAASDDVPFLAAVHLGRVRDLDFVGNAIRDTGLGAELAPRLAGVQLTLVGRARVEGNRVVNLGPFPGGLRDSAAFAVVGSHGPLIFANNTALRSEDAEGRQDKSVWHALQIVPRLRGGGPNEADAVTDITADAAVAWGEANAFVLSQLGAVVVPLSFGGVGIRGNHFEGLGLTSLVVVTSDRVTFSGNTVTCPAEGRLLAELAGQYVILDGNHFESPTGDHEVVRLQVPVPSADTHVPEPVSYTALGNIASGLIRINGQRLPDQLRAPFNREMI